MRCTKIGINFMFVEQTQTFAESRSHTHTLGRRKMPRRSKNWVRIRLMAGAMEKWNEYVNVPLWMCGHGHGMPNTKYIAYIRHSHLPIAVCIYITLTHNSHTKHSRAYLFASANKFVINIKFWIWKTERKPAEWLHNGGTKNRLERDWRTAS